MTDYDVALTIYEKMPADISVISAEEAKRVLAGLGLYDDELDDIDIDAVVEYVNKWIKEEN